VKYVILVGDGMGDYPLDLLGGKTPLQAADIPAIRHIAGLADTRMISTVPEGMAPGSDVANMSLLSYDPSRDYTGRAAIEAVGAGIPMSDRDVAFRCNLVTVTDGLMDDYSAGHISSEEAGELIDALEAEVGRNGLHFHKGVQYRHLLLWEDAPATLHLEPPHEFTGTPLTDYQPRNEAVIELLEKSKYIFKDHPVNRRRIKEGKKPATQIWLWGQGRAMQLKSFQERYGIRGGVVSAVDLVRGIGMLAGLEAPKIPGATGMLDTNVQGKVAVALDMMERLDFIYFHLEAPDECGHMGDALAKVKAIELFDHSVVTPIWKELERRGEPYEMVVCMDHRTPVELMGHTSDPVPISFLTGPVGSAEGFALFDENVNNGISQGMAFDVIHERLQRAF